MNHEQEQAFCLLAPNKDSIPMNRLLIQHIGLLVQAGLGAGDKRQGPTQAHLPTLKDAYLLIENGHIKAFGPMKDCPVAEGQRIDAKGGMVFPCWVDSHTHLVFAGSREQEFVDRSQGLSYEQIAQRGGGILHSAERLRATSEEQLFIEARHRLEEVIGLGTGAIEVKSGYGLSLESELKILRVIKRLKGSSPIPIRSTFLGAHALPKEFKQDREGYLDLVINQMLPAIAAEGLADYIDVFCEKVAFSVAEAERVLEAGAKYGLKAKIHVNQFYALGGIEMAVRRGALSVDHLEVVEEADLIALQAGSTIATLLPSAPFFLNDHFPPGRKLIDAGVPVALASDFNPGTSPSGRMAFVVSLACIKSKLLPEEAINAATINGAYALELEHSLGSIEPGKLANVFITKPIPSLAYLPYAFGSQLIREVIINGKPYTWPGSGVA